MKRAVEPLFIMGMKKLKFICCYLIFNKVFFLFYSRFSGNSELDGPQKDA